MFSGHLDELVALRKLCKRLKLLLTVSQFIIPGHSGKDQSEMMFSEEEYRQYLEIEKTDAMPGASRYIGEVRDARDMNGPICKAGHTALSIDPKGDVFACNSVPNVLGNVRTESLKDIWENSSELKKIRAVRFGDISAECHSCKYSGACVFCLGAALRENHGELDRANSPAEMPSCVMKFWGRCQMLIESISTPNEDFIRDVQEEG